MLCAAWRTQMEWLTYRLHLNAYIGTMLHGIPHVVVRDRLIRRPQLSDQDVEHPNNRDDNKHQNKKQSLRVELFQAGGVYVQHNADEHEHRVPEALEVVLLECC